ncbi:retropepsin-like aspartic protease family protein [Undibacterium sp. RuRC25W]|uniref:retropepsin-like aspartic protease family protein n=1 Tax=Undibacterium sp. RuRC25W TaxID=3413047 RepID=UPI003BF0ED35
MKSLMLVLLMLTTGQVGATDVDVVGLFPGKAILVVDGAPAKAYTVGSMLSKDTKLVAADGETATISVNKKQYTLKMGEAVQHVNVGSSHSVVLQAGERGHFIANASINGVGIKMMVDTGASLVTLPASDAVRLGITYTKGARGKVNTAGGDVTAYAVKLDSIKIGEITLYQVDALVIDTGLSIPLLGMSFLNRMEMRREGDQMTLTKRF